MRFMTTIRPPIFGAVIAAASTLGLAACGSGGGDVATVATGSNEGQTIYQTSCASCHGTDLRGTDKGPSHLSRFYEPSHHGDEAFRSAILNGSPQHHWNFGDMKPVPGLSEGEIDAVIAYVRAIQEKEGFEG